MHSASLDFQEEILEEGFSTPTENFTSKLSSCDLVLVCSLYLAPLCIHSSQYRAEPEMKHSMLASDQPQTNSLVAIS